MFGGFFLFSHSTAKTLIAVRGPAVTYGLLKFSPQIDSRAHSIEIHGFTIRRGQDHFTLQDIPVSRVLPEVARADIVRQTFELDDDERSEYLEIDFEIPEYDERVRIHFRAVEYDYMPEMLFYEVEDESGDWLPVEDVNFVDLLSESFVQTMETNVMATIDAHNLDLLPMAAE
jgi:hypothetical protein